MSDIRNSKKSTTKTYQQLTTDWSCSNRTFFYRKHMKNKKYHTVRINVRENRRGNPIETGNIGYTRHRTKTNKTNNSKIKYHNSRKSQNWYPNAQIHDRSHSWLCTSIKRCGVELVLSAKTSPFSDHASVFQMCVKCQPSYITGRKNNLKTNSS